MSSIFQGVFGGKKSSQSSDQHNQAYGELNSAFSPLFGQATAGANGLSALLGGDPTGFNAYKNATGFDAASEAGSRGITNNAAASGLLRSGDTSKALESYGTGLQNQYAQSYMSNLLDQAKLGLGAGSLVSGAGNVATSKSSSSDKPGLFGGGSPMGMLGALL